MQLKKELLEVAMQAALDGDYEAFKRAYAELLPPSLSLEERRSMAASTSANEVYQRWRIGTDAVQIRSYECEHCQDRGWITVGRFGYDEASKTFTQPKTVVCPNPTCRVSNLNAQRRFEYWKRLFRHIPSGAYYRDMTFDSFLDLPVEQQKGKQLAFSAAYAYAHSRDLWISVAQIYEGLGVATPANLNPKDTRNWLFFYGDYGTGKTGLACAIAHHLESRNIPVLMTRTSDLLAYLIELRTGRDDTTTYTEALDHLREAPIIILDEFELTNMTDAQSQMIQELIRGRHGMRRPTVFTTNGDPDSLYNHWGGKTADVIIELSHLIPLSGVRLRKTGAVIA